MISLESVKKMYVQDSCHSVAPRDTIKKAVAALGQVGNGAFYGLEEIGHLDSMGLPVYKANSAEESNEWGKGISDEQSQASAIMERVERYSSVVKHRKKIDLIRSDFNSIKANAISRNSFELLNFQKALYGERKVDEMEMDWAEATSLISGKKFFVPAQMVFFRYSQRNFKDMVCTTGLASGNSIEEAINHAICEVIERHIFHVTYFNRPAIRQIDISTTKNPYLASLIERLRKKGFTIIANDFTCDMGVSTVSALVFNPDEKIIFNRYFNYATAPDPEIALIRVLTEIAQYRAVSIIMGDYSTSEKGFFTSVSGEVLDYYDWLSKEEEKISFDEIDNISHDDFKVEIESMLEELKKNGYDVLAYDLTHPELNIPVVRVMIPGLQPNFKMLGLSPFSKYAGVSRHLKIYDEVMERISKRQFDDQTIDEFAELS